MLAVIVTSLLRRHLCRRAWRAVHLLAYLSWPVAWLHSLFSSGDMRHGALFLLAMPARSLVVAAVAGGWRPRPATCRAPSGSAC